jgi:predicted transcriptional regulator
MEKKRLGVVAAVFGRTIQQRITRGIIQVAVAIDKKRDKSDDGLAALEAGRVAIDDKSTVLWFYLWDGFSLG